MGIWRLLSEMDKVLIDLVSEVILSLRFFLLQTFRVFCSQTFCAPFCLRLTNKITKLYFYELFFFIESLKLHDFKTIVSYTVLSAQWGVIESFHHQFHSFPEKKCFKVFASCKVSRSEKVSPLRRSNTDWCSYETLKTTLLRNCRLILSTVTLTERALESALDPDPIGS